MIRLITHGLGGEGWLCFEGNEFGHPVPPSKFEILTCYRNGWIFLVPGIIVHTIMLADNGMY